MTIATRSRHRGAMTDETLAHAERLFTDALDWLGRRYGDRVFYVERDIVYTLQSKLNELISSQAGEWRVYNDYPMLPGPRRSLSADLSLLTPQRDVAVAAEFKYEPCHRRVDVLKNKLPVTVWSDIVKDTVRISSGDCGGVDRRARWVRLTSGSLSAGTPVRMPRATRSPPLRDPGVGDLRDHPHVHPRCRPGGQQPRPRTPAEHRQDQSEHQHPGRG